MKKFIPFLFLASLTFAQPGFNHQDQQKFDAIYWAHQPPEVQALQTLPDNQVGTVAQDLALKGDVIDFPIMVWRYDPYATMYYRLYVDGLPWVPSALQPSLCLSIPTASNPPYCPYNPQAMPAGAIKASLDAADYPPFVAPKPPVPAPAGPRLVGPFNGFVYAAGPDAVKNGQPQVVSGQHVVQDGVEYVATVHVSPFGLVIFYNKAQ